MPCTQLDWVEGWRDRRKALKTPGVIISTAGMLKGGPAAFYVSKLGKKATTPFSLLAIKFQVHLASNLWRKASVPSMDKSAK